MVFTSVVNFVRSKGPDEIWRKRRIFKLAAHYINRRRNCYSFAIRAVHRALVYATKGRKLRKLDMIDLWNTRIQAGCEQHGMEILKFQKCLRESDILLNRKSLSNLAIWEPYSFKALTDIAKRKAIDDGFATVHKEEEVDRVIMRGTLNKYNN